MNLWKVNSDPISMWPNFNRVQNEIDKGSDRVLMGSSRKKFKVISRDIKHLAYTRYKNRIIAKVTYKNFTRKFRLNINVVTQSKTGK